eukprot:CAMPEP_0194105786 /NCGR_PEP_ID=MMETSP0150-20130528/5921_1 /TAXON_ID=122233 /ORGANISM="Chaetoceros debilis, Strain MM31A-1" /LENGTH=1944 /DNA_ID=CAMNT_0038793751 /DNA_START=131 /DNA_END=5965 /DNA_ORIENTATION=+
MSDRNGSGSGRASPPPRLAQRYLAAIRGNNANESQSQTNTKSNEVMKDVTATATAPKIKLHGHGHGGGFSKSKSTNSLSEQQQQSHAQVQKTSVSINSTYKRPRAKSAYRFQTSLTPMPSQPQPQVPQPQPQAPVVDAVNVNASFTSTSEVTSTTRLFSQYSKKASWNKPQIKKSQAPMPIPKPMPIPVREDFSHPQHQQQQQSSHFQQEPLYSLSSQSQQDSSQEPQRLSSLSLEEEEMMESRNGSTSPSRLRPSRELDHHAVRAGVDAGGGSGNSNGNGREGWTEQDWIHYRRHSLEKTTAERSQEVNVQAQAQLQAQLQAVREREKERARTVFSASPVMTDVSENPTEVTNNLYQQSTRTGSSQSISQKGWRTRTRTQTASSESREKQKQSQKVTRNIIPLKNGSGGGSGLGMSASGKNRGRQGMGQPQPLHQVISEEESESPDISEVNANQQYKNTSAAAASRTVKKPADIADNSDEKGEPPVKTWRRPKRISVSSDAGWIKRSFGQSRSQKAPPPIITEIDNGAVAEETPIFASIPEPVKTPLNAEEVKVEVEVEVEGSNNSNSNSNSNRGREVPLKSASAFAFASTTPFTKISPRSSPKSNSRSRSSANTGRSKENDVTSTTMQDFIPQHVNDGRGNRDGNGDGDGDGNEGMHLGVADASRETHVHGRSQWGNVQLRSSSRNLNQGHNQSSQSQGVNQSIPVGQSQTQDADVGIGDASAWDTSNLHSRPVQFQPEESLTQSHSHHQQSQQQTASPPQSLSHKIGSDQKQPQEHQNDNDNDGTSTMRDNDASVTSGFLSVKSRLRSWNRQSISTSTQQSQGQGQGQHGNVEDDSIEAQAHSYTATRSLSQSASRSRLQTGYQPFRSSPNSSPVRYPLTGGNGAGLRSFRHSPTPSPVRTGTGIGTSQSNGRSWRTEKDNTEEQDVAPDEADRAEGQNAYEEVKVMNDNDAPAPNIGISLKDRMRAFDTSTNASNTRKASWRTAVTRPLGNKKEGQSVEPTSADPDPQPEQTLSRSKSKPGARFQFVEDQKDIDGGDDHQEAEDDDNDNDTCGNSTCGSKSIKNLRSRFESSGQAARSISPMPMKPSPIRLDNRVWKSKYGANFAKSLTESDPDIDPDSQPSHKNQQDKKERVNQVGDNVMEVPRRRWGKPASTSAPKSWEPKNTTKSHVKDVKVKEEDVLEDPIVDDEPEPDVDFEVEVQPQTKSRPSTSNQPHSSPSGIRSLRSRFEVFSTNTHTNSHSRAHSSNARSAVQSADALHKARQPPVPERSLQRKKSAFSTPVPFAGAPSTMMATEEVQVQPSQQHTQDEATAFSPTELSDMHTSQFQPSRIASEDALFESNAQAKANSTSVKSQHQPQQMERKARSAFDKIHNTFGGGNGNKSIATHLHPMTSRIINEATIHEIEDGEEEDDFDIDVDMEEEPPSQAHSPEVHSPDLELVDRRTKSNAKSKAQAQQNDIPWEAKTPNDIPWNQFVQESGVREGEYPTPNTPKALPRPAVDMTYGIEYLDCSYDDDDNDGVTLSPTPSDVSSLSIPTCLQSIASTATSDADSGAIRSGTSVSVSVTGKQSSVLGPSEASSSQTSEAATPLIHTTLGAINMKFGFGLTSSSDTTGVSLNALQYTNLLETLPPPMDDPMKFDDLHLGHAENDQKFPSKLSSAEEELTFGGSSKQLFEEQLNIQPNPKWKNDFFAVDSVKSLPTAESIGNRSTHNNNDGCGWVAFPDDASSSFHLNSTTTQASVKSDTSDRQKVDWKANTKTITKAKVKVGIKPNVSSSYGNPKIPPMTSDSHSLKKKDITAKWTNATSKSVVYGSTSRKPILVNPKNQTSTIPNTHKSNAQEASSSSTFTTTKRIYSRKTIDTSSTTLTSSMSKSKSFSTGSPTNISVSKVVGTVTSTSCTAKNENEAHPGSDVKIGKSSAYRRFNIQKVREFRRVRSTFKKS